MTDFKARFEALLDYSSDGEECNACFAIEDICPYHVGVTDACAWFSKHLARIAEDPERLNLLAERKAVAR